MSQVHGTVKFDGSPIEKGTILFATKDTPPVEYGGSIANGQYDAKVPPGTMKVTISSLKATGKKKKAYDTPESLVIDEMIEVIPDRYNLQSELQFEVKPGKNQKDWDLKK